jgi:hypothetical protein
MIKAVVFLVCGLGLIFSHISDNEIHYFQTPNISLDDTSDLSTALINDTVYQVKSSDGIPLYYYSLLNTGVCFDNKCRPLSINIYWNITGRYLGFELPDEEFLSKTDHEPFTNAEYLQLDSLLANPFLPLGKYDFYDLVDASYSGDPEVDGTSGATSQEVKDYLVPGAAYTTHKLWNEIYGPTQVAVIAATEKELIPSLFYKILESPISADRILAAERTAMLGELSDSTVDTLVNFIQEEDYSESYIALKSITPFQLRSEYLQTSLFELIGNVEYSIENQIYEKLKEAKTLSGSITALSVSQLNFFSDMQLVNILKLLKHHNIISQELNRDLRQIAESKNPYVKSQISKFPESTP